VFSKGWKKGWRPFAVQIDADASKEKSTDTLLGKKRAGTISRFEESVGQGARKEKRLSCADRGKDELRKKRSVFKTNN